MAAPEMTAARARAPKVSFRESARVFITFFLSLRSVLLGARQRSGFLTHPGFALAVDGHVVVVTAGLGRRRGAIGGAVGVRLTRLANRVATDGTHDRVLARA